MATKKQEAYDGSTPLNSIRQETFVSNLLSNMNQTDAYMTAYPTCKNRETAKVNASRLLLTNANVKARLEYKRAELAEKTEITVGSLQRKMYNLGIKAEKAGKYTAAATCWRDLMKTVGGFQADKQPEANLIGKALDSETTKDIRKALEAVFQRKYLALPKPVVSEVIEAENVVVLDDM